MAAAGAGVVSATVASVVAGTSVRGTSSIPDMMTGSGSGRKLVVLCMVDGVELTIASPTFIYGPFSSRYPVHPHKLLAVPSPQPVANE